MLTPHGALIIYDARKTGGRLRVAPAGLEYGQKLATYIYIDIIENKDYLISRK